MTLNTILDMAAGNDNRIAVGSLESGGTSAHIQDLAARAATWFVEQEIDHVVYIAEGSDAFPVALFGSELAGLPFAPLNYRWATTALHEAIDRLGRVMLIADSEVAQRLTHPGPAVKAVVTSTGFLDLIASSVPIAAPMEMQSPVIALFTSGTSGTPKIATLSAHNITSYIFGTADFGSSAAGDAQIVSVPPYHIAGIANLLSSLYVGRRIVYFPHFEPRAWVEAVERESITHAMLVPTMLARILDVLKEDDQPRLTTLRHISYGGGRMPRPIITELLRRLPATDFVNGYGLTETSSSITVLGPQDHRDSLLSEVPEVSQRLGSVGRALPTVELTVRDDSGNEVPAGEVGEVWVRGDQVSGHYTGSGSVLDAEGWFRTKDSGRVDSAGFLFVEGRLDDVIVRGGENISPGEIEDVLISYPSVSDAGVVGIPDDDWGEVVVAAVVPAANASVDITELDAFVRTRLRSSKAPHRIVVTEALPYNDNGKLVRRVLRSQLLDASSDRQYG